MKATPWWLLAVLLVTPALAGELFEQPRSAAQAGSALRAAMPGYEQLQVLRGRFRQHKYLNEIPRPLLSTGEFLLLRGRGIWWHTQTPLDSALTLKAGNRQQPGIDVAASIFLALFALDLDTLARSFDLFMLEPAPPERHWLLGLRPRDAALAAWFRQATLSGDERVRQVTLLEVTGDRTEIELDVVAQPLSSLAPAERQRFAP